ncbi:MAG: matrixin family metalloprotease [Deltaproteobacteria bacterium]|nr:matrixin family metalloprotease [Deltaproteobacteria bacterium]
MSRWLTVAVLAMTQVAWTQYFTSTGMPVRWYDAEVVVKMDANGTSDVPGDLEFDAVRTSMQTWNDVECPHPMLKDGGTVSGEVPGEMGPNLLIWEDETQWSHIDRPKVIALTTLYYNDSTGKVARFDMEFADHKFQFTVSDDPAQTHIDVQNTVTHEMGHVLGLDHSLVAQATMYFKTDDSEPFRMRTLDADDIEGLCSVYGSIPNLPDGQTQPDGYSWPDSGPWITSGSSDGGSCSASTGARADPAAMAMMVLAMMAALLIARKRARGVGMACLIAAAMVATASAPAKAGDDLDIRIRSKALAGRDRPAIIIGSASRVRNLKVRLMTGKRLVKAYPAVNLAPGRPREFPIDQAPGEREYRAEITRSGQDAPEIITFKAVVARPMALVINRDTVDLAEGRIAFVASAPVRRVKLEILGEGGATLKDREYPVESRAGETTSIRFEPPSESVTLVRLTAFDPWDFYNGVEIRPFFVEIPHEEVLFEFGKAAIRPSEESKLRKTLKDVRSALARLGNEFRARLYVAGYTDTVGTPGYNRDLSRRRAKSIAGWFKSHGLKCGVCYQGFGEDALEVDTPDETPEPRNRRTVHVLANQHPPVSKTFPRRDWKCL